MANSDSELTKLNNLIEQFHSKVKEITQIATNCPKGGNDSWIELIKQYNVEPVPENQKTVYYTQGIAIVKGAFPSELRRIYQSLRFDVISNFRQNFSEVQLSFDASMLWDDFVRYLETFIDKEISNYVGEIKQKVGVSDIFANAFSGMNKFSVGLKESNLDTKQCKSCGSPRLDEDQYGSCYFCGTLLFETTKLESKCEKCGSPKFAEDQGEVCRHCGN